MNTCPNDTNGDGDCGRVLCPYCNAQKAPVTDDAPRPRWVDLFGIDPDF